MPSSSGFVSVIGFNSAFGASQFAFNNPTLNPVPVQVPQGFSPPSYGLSGPNPSVLEPPQFWVSVFSPTLSGIPSGYNTQFTYDLTNNKVITQRNIDPNTITVTDSQNNPIFQNGQPVTSTALTDQPPVPFLDNPFAQVEQPTPYTPALPFDYKAIYDNPDLRKFIQRSQPNIAQQAEQYNLEQQNFLDQVQQYLEQQKLLQPIADIPSDPNVLKSPAIPDIETTPLEPIPLPQTADPSFPEYKGPDPLTLPPYAPLPDLPGEIIQPPRGFDPWDQRMNRPSIKPQAQPISYSGDGGGGPSAFTGPIVQGSWQFTLSGTLIPNGLPAQGNCTILAPSNTFFAGYYSNVIFTQNISATIPPPGLTVTWNAAIGTFNLPNWLTNSVPQGNLITPQVLTSAIGAKSFTANFQIFGAIINSSLGVGFYGTAGTNHIGDANCFSAGGYSVTNDLFHTHDLGITMPVTVGGFSAIYTGNNPSQNPGNWRVYQIQIQLDSVITLTVFFSY